MNSWSGGISWYGIYSNAFGDQASSSRSPQYPFSIEIWKCSGFPGTGVHGWAERHGIRFFELRARLSGKFNAIDANEVFGEVFRPGTNTVYYNFKHFPAPDWNGLDYAPRLVRGEVTRFSKSVEAGEAEIVLNSSDQDPWDEVEPLRVLGATYTISNSSMLWARLQ